MYKEDSGSALHRSSLYTFWRRIVGSTTLFENATRQVCPVRGIRTNTPLHALTTPKDVTYVEAARFLAERIMAVASAETDRLRWAFRLATSREHHPDEIAILLRRLQILRSEYAASPEAPWHYFQ